MFSKWRFLIIFTVLTVLAAGCGVTTPAATPETAVPQPTEAQVRVTITAAPTREIQATPPEMKVEPTAVPTAAPKPTLDLELKTWPAEVQVEWADVWDDPAKEKSYWNRQTQLLLGERVRVVAEAGDWAQIVAVQQPSSKDQQGYPGWVRREALSAGWSDGPQWAVVMMQTVPLYAEADEAAKIILRLHLDVRLPVMSADEQWVQLRLPGGRSGWAARAGLRLAADPDAAAPLDGIWDTALTLQGRPYLWGGASGYSLDCSGFTYRLFHAYGIALARDANDQALQGQAVPAGAWRMGDLFFYSDVVNGPVTHVVMYWGDGQVMDAEPELGLTLHPMADLSQHYVWHSARRMLPEGTK
ncbi:MAG TPA: NlpC/P60 family protein [Anaerolineaceae bacterium]|nr:NlpC/P60 family protein [Anaerolineaceae bacterium]HPN50531.1 NlpC/P60 family protein [Anaerolineaceae bacterium]